MFHLVLPVIQVNHLNLGPNQINMRRQQIEIGRFCNTYRLSSRNVIDDALVNTRLYGSWIVADTRG